MKARAFAVGIMFAATIARADVRYTVTDLGSVRPDMSSHPCDINAKGQVAGYCSDIRGYQRAFLWDRETGIQDIGTLVDWGWSHAEAINDNGQVVGYAQNSSSDVNAFLWQDAIGMQNLGNFGGYSSRAYDINNAGQIAVSVHMPNLSEHAYLLQIGNGLIDVGGATWGTELAVNNSTEVVGQGIYSHAFHWSTASGIQDIGTLGGYYSYAYDINDNGLVVGAASYSGYSNYHAFAWQDGGSIQDLGTLGGSYSGAFGINNNGFVVGFAKTTSSTSDSRAFLWTSDKGMQDLNDLISPSAGWNLLEARAINDSGQIVGYGINANGGGTAFLLNPIPEPSSALLLYVGVIVALGFGTFKRIAGGNGS